MRLDRVVRTALFRLTLLYVAVFLGFSVILSVGGAFAFSLIFERQIRAEIEEEVAMLAAEFAKAGPDDLVRRIERRAREEDEFDYLY